MRVGAIWTFAFAIAELCTFQILRNSSSHIGSWTWHVLHYRLA